MNAITANIAISPVNMEDRQNLGIKAGDTVRVHQKIQDKDKYRIQVFEGLVLARKHGDEPGATFTVRKVVDGIGVEKIFPLYSPMIDKIEIVRRSKVRRAKLYYIREKVAREIKRQMRRMRLVALTTESEAEAAARAEEEAKKAEEAEKAAEEAKAQEAKDAPADEPETPETEEAQAEPTEEVSETPAADETETKEDEEKTEPADEPKETESEEDKKE